MVSLPQHRSPEPDGGGSCGACGDGQSCGAGLERIYPTTAVRFGAMNWIGEFTYKPGTVFRCGAKVVAQTDRGIELGEQVSLFCNGCSNQVTRAQIQAYIKNSGPEFYRLNSGRIMREATDQDVEEHRRLNLHNRDDLDRCAMLAMQFGLAMKIVTVEHLLGGERIVFYFRSDERIDFRQLVKELASQYRTRIEMRQVGARDEARLVADYEVCGRECCCKNFLKKLRPVSMKMAKIQKSTLDPSKVSGRCGRLRCCLRYEHEGYEALMKKLPRVGERVRTEFGDGAVLDRQILTQLVLIGLDDDRQVAVPVEEILEFNVAGAAPGEPPAAAQSLEGTAPRLPNAEPLPEESAPDVPYDDQERRAGASLPDRSDRKGRRRRGRPRGQQRQGDEGHAARSGATPQDSRDAPASSNGSGSAFPRGAGDVRSDGRRRRRRRRTRGGPERPRDQSGDQPRSEDR